MPVSEVGDAVIGRGFALLHDGTVSVDTAQHLWTLDNPANGWFGLSSAVRVRLGRTAVRAMSVAEVVSPCEETSGPMARALMVALVRAGVTATCSGADKQRYGHLDVDSNLPDTRIALGGPTRNTFTKALLAEADPVYTAELDRQLAKTGRARVWVPAAREFRPLASVWVPDADLRHPRALPVLVIDGSDDKRLKAAIASVADDLADFEILVTQATQQAPSEVEPFESRTVALFNRGVPSFAVDTEGTLHTALMRSCTGWPSGTWIDEPRRTAPDGSNFQLMHWTQVFDYALVCDDGDWRQAQIPTRSAQFSNPLIAVRPTLGGPQNKAPRLGPTGSLLQIEPADSVHLGALKAAGNPMAAGSGDSVDPRAVALRLVETTGAGTRVAIGSELGKLRSLQLADLLEKPTQRKRSIDLHGYQVATVLARLEMPRAASDSGTALAPHAEAAQPLYARYWLHNRGPAPLGGLPAVAHLHPQRLTAAPGGEVVLRLIAASDCSDAELGGEVAVVCPAGWSATPAELPFTLGSGEYLETDVSLAIPAHAEPGLYPVRAQLRIGGDKVPAAWRQVVEDVCVVEVGASHEAGLIYLADGPAEITLAAGDTARLAVTIGTHARADLALEAHLISPWGTWEWIGPAALGAVLPARGKVELGFDVTPPAWLEPGQWWALIRVGCAGQLVYSPAVKVTVT
jgi:alpha-mannosidase